MTIYDILIANYIACAIGVAVSLGLWLCKIDGFIRHLLSIATGIVCITLSFPAIAGLLLLLGAWMISMVAWSIIGGVLFNIYIRYPDSSFSRLLDSVCANTMFRLLIISLTIIHIFSFLVYNAGVCNNY